MWFVGVVWAGTAPTRDWNGLTFGSSDAAAIEAWASAHGAACDVVPSPRRVTTHVRCGSPSEAAAGVPASPGRLETVLLVHVDDGPIHHVSVDRLVEATESVAAYDASVARLTKVYGAPTKAMAGPTRFDGPLVRSATDWKFDDLEVRVTLLRNGKAGPVRVTERWDVPGVEAAVPERPGSTSAHGGGDSPSARNPHLED